RSPRNWLELTLRAVDDQRISRGIAAQSRLHGGPRRIGRTFDVADLRHAQRLGKHLVGNAVAAKGLERSGQYRSGLGIERELRVVFEQRERQAVEVKPQRRRETDRARADNDDGRHAAHPSTLVRGKGEVPADDRRGHRRLIGQQAPTASSGCPTPTVARQCASSAPAFAVRYCGVSITPDATRLKRARCCAVSLAALLAKAISAALLAA